MIEEHINSMKGNVTFFKEIFLLCGDALYSRWHGIVSDVKLKQKKTLSI